MANLSIREFREAAKLTLEELAGDADISVSQLSRIERDMRDARASELQRLAKRFAIPVGRLFGEPAPTMVPLVSWISAGRLAEAANPIPRRDLQHLSFTDLGSGDFIALRVQGDSMDRISPDGSIIVVNRLDKLVVPNKPYVFSVRGEATYKLWRDRPARLVPYSTNPLNDQIYVEDDDGVAVVGRVKRTVLDL